MLFYTAARLTAGTGNWSFAAFTLASGVYYCSVLVATNVMNTMTSKYAIKGDPHWGPNVVTTTTAMIQVMLARIVGPILGEYFYFHLGTEAHPTAGYGAFLIIGSLASAVVSYIAIQ